MKIPSGTCYTYIKNNNKYFINILNIPFIILLKTLNKKK